jgi:hypothetical protein
MTTTAKFPAAVLALTDVGGDVVNFGELVLNTSIISSTTSIVATTTIPAGWPQVGFISIDTEIIKHTSWSGSTFTTVVAPNGRGFDNTTAASHTAGAAIKMADTALRFNQPIAEVIALENTVKNIHSVTAYAAVGDGTTDDTTAIQNAITAAPAGSVIVFPFSTSYYKITAAITVGKALTFLSYGAEIRQATSNTGGFSVTASDVHFRGLKITGPQFAASQANERGIKILGTSAASPITDITIKDCEINTWGQDGVYAKWANDVDISGNRIYDCWYSGLQALSCLRGTVSGNRIRNITGTPNAYGVALTRENSSSLSTDPRCADFTVAANTVDGVAIWEGLDTHGGQRITFVGNTVRNCEWGIVVTDSKNGSAVDTYAPLDCAVTGNTIDSTKTDGTASPGVVFNGAAGSVGSPVQKGTGCIVGNTIRGHGDSTNVLSGAIYARDTQGLVIAGNTLIEPSPHGINLYHDNYGFVISGNQITDPWTNTVGVGEAVAIYLTDNYNKGLIDGNTHSDDAKTATYLNTRLIRIANFANNAANVGINRSEATDELVDIGGYAITPALARGAGLVGYVGTGTGGAVTQITSAATSVTLNKATGQITTVALTTAAAAEERFTVNNTSVVATDCIALGTTYNGAGTPAVSVLKVAAGAFDIVITNLHSATALNAVMVINFAVVKAVAA